MWVMGWRSMAQTIVEWSNVSSDNGRKYSEWGVSSLISHVKLIKDEGINQIEWSFSPVIRSEILDPSRYVKLSLDIFSSLNSGTAAALYEICNRYLTNRDGLSSKEEWEWWRPRITGFPDAKYKKDGEYKTFKRNTLIPAIKEINAVSNIEVELLEFKTGRFITHIQFSAKLKKPSSANVSKEEAILDAELLKRIVDFGIPEDLATRIYFSTDEESIRTTLTYVEARVSKGRVESPAALFRDALNKGYGKAEGAKLSIPSPRKTKAIPTPVIDDAQAIKASEEVVAADSYIQSLSQEESAQLEKDFVASLRDGVILAYYKKSGLSTRAVKVELRRFVIDNILSHA